MNAHLVHGFDTSKIAFSSSLERPETKLEIAADAPAGEYPDDAELAERFRHSGWKRQRLLIFQALRRTEQSRSRLDNFRECGSQAFVYKATDVLNKYRLGGSSCRDRFCIPCAIDRSRCLATNVLNELDGKPTRFITLTIKQTNAPLLDVLDKLYDCFRRLRARRIWKNGVVGGCGFVEIKWSTTNQAWNVHIHCIVHGSYIYQRYLSNEWYKITGNSMITDIRLVKDNRRIGQYVTKYVSKPFNDTFVNRTNQLDEVITATKGRRLALTFGDWRGIKLTESPSEHDWISLGSFHDVVTRAAQGDRECLAAINSICRDVAPKIIEAVARAQPPPEPPKIVLRQLTFTWPAIDFTF